jgi:PIN domain nuclease of toxin-antitoxin system
MKLLLDTRVLVWAESRVESLGSQTRDLLLAPSNTLLVSPVSPLELSRWISLSRLILSRPLADWLATARRNLLFEDAAITHEIVLQSYLLAGDFHKDPADRILVATARVLGCTLVTADTLILNYPHLVVWDARK